MNVSFGLKTGWSQAGSVLAACISIGLFALIKPKLAFSMEEANVAQTVASAAGSMTMSAGLIGPMPALALLGYEFSYLGLASWSISVAYLGVFLAVPLRDHFLVQHRLKFPSGTATAECIRAAFALPSGNSSKVVVTVTVLPRKQRQTKNIFIINNNNQKIARGNSLNHFSAPRSSRSRQRWLRGSSRGF
jgi:uncharacterized oligopeptide transporter (OPT) family protein